jgi:hypothetical protein
MEVLCGLSGMIRMLAQLEIGQGIGGKFRIPDGKVGVWSVFMFRAPKVVALTCVN